MKFHELDMQGNTWIERLPSLPTWESSFIGRLVYNTSDGILYYADPSKWMPIYIFQRVAVSGQTTVTADNADDTLTLVEGNDFLITTSGNSITLGLNATTKVYMDYVKNFITSGRRLWIYEDVAPTGWTIVSGTSDGLLAVKGGSQAYNVTGGVQAGTWTHNHTLSVDGSHTHTTPSHTLSVNEMPAHTHYIYRTSDDNASAGDYYPFALVAGGSNGHNYRPSQWTGGIPADTYGYNPGTTQPHSHGDTGSVSSHTHTVGDNSAWRMLANVGIIIEKD